MRRKGGGLRTPPGPRARRPPQPAGRLSPPGARAASPGRRSHFEALRLSNSGAGGAGDGDGGAGFAGEAALGALPRMLQVQR